MDNPAIVRLHKNPVDDQAESDRLQENDIPRSLRRSCAAQRAINMLQSANRLQYAVQLLLIVAALICIIFI